MSQKILFQTERNWFLRPFDSLWQSIFNQTINEPCLSVSGEFGHLELLEAYGEGVRRFCNSDLEGHCFSDMELLNVNLSRSFLSCANFSDSILIGSVFSKANLTKSSFMHSDLRSTDFREANLSGAWLNEADLRGADLRGACFKDAWLDGVDLVGAKYDEKIFEADLENARLKWTDPKIVSW